MKKLSVLGGNANAGLIAEICQKLQNSGNYKLLKPRTNLEYFKRFIENCSFFQLLSFLVSWEPFLVLV